MADREQDEADKQYDPSERKLTRAREQGDVIRSEDMQTAVAYGGLVLGLAVAGAWALIAAGKAGMSLLEQADRISDLPDDGYAPLLTGLVVAMSAPLIVVLALPPLCVLVYLVATRSLTFSAEKLAFKGSRLSILSNARQKFGRAGLVEFFKRLVKMLAVAALLTFFLISRMDEVFLSHRLEPGPITGLLSRQVFEFISLFLVIALGFGILDVFWQRSEFLRRHRMTRQELMDEHKESEGDPQLKADRRRRAHEIATNRMLAEVPKADVVIVNPTHYAVALSWSRRKGSVPRCVAKGADEIAARIRASAQEHGVPIRQDAPTARAIFATVEIGQEIRIEHYATVAAAIRFADAMRKRARRR